MVSVCFTALKIFLPDIQMASPVYPALEASVIDKYFTQLKEDLKEIEKLGKDYEKASAEVKEGYRLVLAQKIWDLQNRYHKWHWAFLGDLGSFQDRIGWPHVG
jgi:hypothetical protein